MSTGYIQDGLGALGGAVSSFGVNTALGAFYNRVRTLIEDRKIRLSCREFLEYLFENKECDYSSFVRVLIEADRALSFEALREDVTKEVSAVCDDRESVPAYVDVVLLYAAQRSDKVRAWVDGYFEKRKKNAQEVERNKFLIELGNLFDKMVHSEDVFSLDWFDENLLSATGGKLSIGFFSDFDAIFERKLSELVEKREYRTIEVHSSDERKDAFYYVLYVLRKYGFSDKVKVIRDRKVWESKPLWAPGDILVADFDDYTGNMTIHGECINIRLYDRNTPPDSDSPNYLRVRRPSFYVLRKALESVKDNNQKAVDILLEKTNGNFSLIEAELTDKELPHSWDKVWKKNPEFDSLVSFLVVPRFSVSVDKTDSDFEILEKAGLDPQNIIDDAEEINREPGCPLLYTTERGDICFYSLASPDRLWFTLREKGGRKFLSSFVSKAEALLSEEGVSSTLVNNAVYTFIRHRGDLIAVCTEEEFFRRTAPGLLERKDREKMLSSLTELSPRLMLNLFRDNSSEIRNENYIALALLIHDENLSIETIRLILDNYREDDVFHPGGNIGDVIREFFRPGFDMCGATADEVCGILSDVKNTDGIMEIIRSVLYREDIAITLIDGYYRYKNSYTEEYRERSQEDYLKIELYEMKWYLDNADISALISFVESVDFVYFDIFSSLESAVRRIVSSIDDRDSLRLYSAFFDTCYKWNRSRWAGKDEIVRRLTPVFELAVPSKPVLKIALYFCHRYFYLLRSEFRNDRADFYKVLSDIVRKEGVGIDEFLAVPSYLEEDEVNWDDYVKVLFDVYPCDAVKRETYLSLSQSGRRYYSFRLCTEHKRDIDGVYEFLTDEDKLLFLENAFYSDVMDRVEALPPVLYERYWKDGINFRPCNLDKPQKLHSLDMLIRHGSSCTAFILLDMWCDDFTPPELLGVLEKLSVFGKAGNSSMHLERAFEKLRASSDVSFGTVFTLEEKLLASEDLAGDDTFFTWSFKESPRMFCSLMKVIFKNEDGVTGNYDEEQYKEALERYYSIKVCPGVGEDYSVDYSILSSWVNEYITMMTEQRQRKAVAIGLGRILSFSVRKFDVILSDEVCRLLDGLGREYKSDTVRLLAVEISNRQGCYTESGRVMADLSSKFREYERELSNRGFKAGSRVYRWLSSMYECRDEMDRNA